MFKRSSSTLDKHESSNVVRRDCVSTGIVEKRDIDRGIIETETVTVTERVKPSTKIKAKGKVDHGVNILTDSIGREFIAIFDSLTRVVEVSITLPEEKETETKTESKREQRDSERQHTSKNNVALRQDDESTYVSKSTTKESKPDYKWIWYALFGAVVIFILIRKKII